MRPASEPRFRVARFLFGFGILYGLLICPWPGLDKFYSRGFCALGESVFARSSGPRFVHFSSETGAASPLDTRITLANRALLDDHGTGPAIVLATSSRALGWLPTAMVLALIWATPMSWKRRGTATLKGLACVHGVILLSLAVYIWNHSDASSGLRLMTFSPLVKHILSGLEETLIAQLGASFSFPVLIWIVIALREAGVPRFTVALEDFRRTPEMQETPLTETDAS